MAQLCAQLSGARRARLVPVAANCAKAVPRPRHRLLPPRSHELDEQRPRGLPEPGARGGAGAAQHLPERDGAAALHGGAGSSVGLAAGDGAATALGMPEHQGQVPWDIQEAGAAAHPEQAGQLAGAAAFAAGAGREAGAGRGAGTVAPVVGASQEAGTVPSVADADQQAGAGASADGAALEEGSPGWILGKLATSAGSAVRAGLDRPSGLAKALPGDATSASATQRGAANAAAVAGAVAGGVIDARPAERVSTGAAFGAGSAASQMGAAAGDRAHAGSSSHAAQSFAHAASEPSEKAGGLAADGGLSVADPEPAKPAWPQGGGTKVAAAGECGSSRVAPGALRLHW
jgi:hypothetical protein